MSYKAQAMSRELADRLGKRLAVVESTGTDGDPILSVGSVAINGNGGTIRVKAISWPLAKDVLGLASTVFTPHVIQMVTEDDASATPATLLAMLGESLAMGTRLEWYKSANGTAPVEAEITSANLKASFESLYWPMVSTQ